MKAMTARAGILLALACAVPSAMAQAPDTLRRIAETGVINMGVREASGAMSYALGAGDYTGFHVDVCRRVTEDLRKQLGLKKLDIRFHSVTAQTRMPLLQNGTVDIECGTTTNTAARQRDVWFAPTLYVEEVRVAVKAKSGITSLSQLANRVVGATAGTTSVQLIRKHERATGVDFKELYGKDNSEAFLLLETDKADALVADGQVLATLISQSRQPGDYVLLKEVLSVEPIAIMLPKGDAAFKRAVDESITRIAKGGEAAALYQKWFVQPIPPNNRKVGLPASDLTKAAWSSPSDRPLEEYVQK